MTHTGEVRAELLRVLIVEHDEADVELCVAALRRAGFQVTHDVAATPPELGACLRGAEYDIVLADYRLPNWTGMDALRELRTLGSDLPLILVTGTLGDERAVECIKAGAADYILKQNLSRLPFAVRHAVEERRAKQEAVRAEARVREAELEVREREQRFVQLADNISEVFFLVGAQFEKTYFINRAYEEIWGRSRQTLYDNPKVFTEAVVPEDLPIVFDNMARVQRGEDPGTIEFRLARPNGEIRRVLSHAVPIFDDAGKVVQISGVALDVTAQRSLENQLLQSQKMEAMGRLAGGVAHDFNNLLTVIISYSDLLDASLGPSDPRHLDLNEIRKAGIAASELTRQLLAFSRQQVIQPRVLALGDVVKGTEKMLRRLIGEDVELETVIGGTALRVTADPGQLEQVIMNLVVNARDAMPTGGKLTIETTAVTLDDAYARAHWPAVVGQFAMLAVSDTGVGMDAATQVRIFEPFFTTKEVGKGTGLGLATVYGIVKQSGGFIWVYSEPGRGTTFKVYWPFAEVGSDTAPAAAGSVVERGGTETLLIVEDSPAVGAAVRASLERLGYTILHAASGQAALELAENHLGAIHLLLTDVVMPGMSGSELVAQFSQRHPTVKVLYMSGYTDDSVVRHGVLSSTVHYIQKPFTPVALAQKVRDLLDAPAR